MSVSCSFWREALQDRWVQGGGRDAPEREARAHAAWADGAWDACGRDSGWGAPGGFDLEDHLATCASCRSEAESLARLDDSLRSGLKLLAASVPAPAEERLARALQELRQDDFEARRLRRLRKSLRLVLWCAFYSFTMLAACLLAMALFRALLGG